MTATENRTYGHKCGTAVDMSTSLGSVAIPSPVLTASGCSAFGGELEPFVDLAAIGAVVTKSVQLRPRSGRPTPRMAETPSGMLNSIGLQGPGIDGLLADDLPWLAERGARAFVSIAGTRVEDFAELATAAGVPSYVAVEESMACGIGVCMTCVLQVIGEDGRTRFSRSCTEGPVFGGDRVRFADVGKLPGDLLGADAMGVTLA